MYKRDLCRDRGESSSGRSHSSPSITSQATTRAIEAIVATTSRHHDKEFASTQTVELTVATAPVASAATSADFSPGTNSHGRLARTMPMSRRQRPRTGGRATRCPSSASGFAMPLTSERTARRARECIRSPPSAGSDKTAVRCSGSVWTSRCRPSWSWSGSSVRPTTRSQSCSRARACSRPTAIPTSSEPVVNGSLTTVMSQASPWSGGSRSDIRRAIAVGEAGSATSPTRIGSTWVRYPPRPQKTPGRATRHTTSVPVPCPLPQPWSSAPGNVRMPVCEHAPPYFPPSGR